MMRMRSQRARILAWTSVTMVAILVVVVAGGYAAIRLGLSGITHVSKIDTRQRPPRYKHALNILLLGSDTRTGRNRAIGGPNGRACSDTIMVAHISPGRGGVALEFWRTRYNVADGSDIARISRDQYLMAQIVKGVLHSGMLRSPTKLVTVIGDVADAMTTDASNTELLHIATSLRGVSARNVQFITAPWVSYPYNPNEVEFAQPEADAVFWAVAHDTAIPPIGKSRHHFRAETVKGQKNGPIDAGPAGQLLTLNPEQVKVTVLNGASGADLSSAAAAGLTSRGFSVLGTGYAPSTGYRKSVIEYGSGADLSAARTLRGQFSSVKLSLVSGLAPGTVDVILGSSFKKLTPPKPTTRASIAALASNYGGIKASVSCRNSAFYSSHGTLHGP